tara:strand:+ start:19103 stop:19774 length:672 start_codon:yes stop_codon:yes gene_type:complete
MKLYPILESILSENEVFENIETLIGEDYPSSFNMDEFKKLSSFAARIRYCEEHLQRISSGSSRIVYKIDNDKVLKLAKNQKGLAQNEIEVGYSKEYMLDGVVAKIFDYHPRDLWVEMQLATKLTKPTFQSVTGLNWESFAKVIENYGITHNSNKKAIHNVTDEEEQAVWENEFSYEILQFIGGYDVPAGDLARLNSYGLVDGGKSVVIIDYGLTHEVYDSYYN